MDAGSQQSRLQTVSSLASTLADELLAERLEGGSFSPEKGDALKKASLLLEECEHPIPEIVADALAQFHQGDVVDAEDPADASPSSATGGAKGAFLRFIRSVRPTASAQ